jgi:hypothetical protein
LLTRLWSSLPVQTQQQILRVLSQLVAKNLPPATGKEAGHERR